MYRVELHCRNWQHRGEASAMWRLYFTLAALTWCVDSVGGFSNGKVGVACGDMEPQHGHEPRPEPPPYMVSVDKSTFSPGENITVSLQVASSDPMFFRGFLMEARDAGKLDSPAVGFFILTDPHQSQLLQCGHTQIAGPVVSLRGMTAAPTTAVSPQATSPTALSTQFSSVGCGHSKSCLRDPVGCDPESDPHCFFLSFTTDEAGRSVMFELSGPTEGYVSFALSHDKWMGNDDVYLCENDRGSVTISAGYVSGRTHPELAAEEALWGRAWRLVDGVIQCRFHRSIHLHNRFNLNQSYFLFLAHGRSHNGLIYKHHHQPLISTIQKVITGPPEDLSGSRSPLLIKFHGVFMLTVWMWIVSTAALIARHYKDFWPDTTVLGQRLWFQLHRTMMVLAVVLTSAAFTLPFIYRRGWSKGAGSHPYIGCAVMALSIIQPIMAILRPVPESPRRIIFRWLHFGAGTAAQILATVCVFLGAAQQALLLPSPWSPAVLTGWLLWIMMVDLLLLIHQCGLRGNCSSDDKENISFAQLDRLQHGEISKVKKMVLVVFLIGNTGFLAAFIKTIASL
ncbi:putative ferric-chelate reductase 1 isoform X7 [Hippoglossus hippoglossus]|uniref:putative ferric-chelate reductase 1 isoform X7 n=1 Tax=Hippoglossus hippoglossus TaxID=8267 RepID=UPI00148CB212|nr:putative ferric-chelate reductase 1 isoform X7 [Hippoglossus hippoglossus]